MKKFMNLTAALALMLLGFTSPTQATDIEVAGGVVAIATDGQCSLREAIINANDDAATHSDCPAGSGIDTIILDGATFTLNNPFADDNGLPPITSEIAIEGGPVRGKSPRRIATILRATDAPDFFRIFNITDLGDLTLDRVTVAGGRAEFTGGDDDEGNGGGIFNNGALTVVNSSIRDNTANGPESPNTIGVGAGIYNNIGGTVEVTGSTIHGNSAFCSGGGIFNNGMLTVIDSIIRSNTVADCDGAGLFNGRHANVIDSTIRDNTAAFDGGGIFNAKNDSGQFDGDLTVIDSTIRDNTAGDKGGGILNRGIAQLTDSTIRDNAAATRGGGIYNQRLPAELTVTNSKIRDNTAGTDGGGIFNNNGDVFLMDVIFEGNEPNDCVSCP